MSDIAKQSSSAKLRENERNTAKIKEAAGELAQTLRPIIFRSLSNAQQLIDNDIDAISRKQHEHRSKGVDASGRRSNDALNDGSDLFEEGLVILQRQKCEASRLMDALLDSKDGKSMQLVTVWMEKAARERRAIEERLDPSARSVKSTHGSDEKAEKMAVHEMRTIQVECAASGQAIEPAPGSDEKTEKKIILMVDDQPDSVADLLKYEMGSEYKIAIARSGEEALSKLKTLKPSLVILDMNMPGMGGMGFLDKIRTSGVISSFPVLAMTAKNDFERKALLAGATSFIAKPCDPEDLLKEIKRLLSPGNGGQRDSAQVQQKQALYIMIAGSGDASSSNLACAMQLIGFKTKVCRIERRSELLEKALVEKPDIILIKWTGIVGHSLDYNALRVMLEHMPATKSIRVVRYEDGGSESLPILIRFMQTSPDEREVVFHRLLGSGGLQSLSILIALIESGTSKDVPLEYLNDSSRREMFDLLRILKNHIMDAKFVVATLRLLVDASMGHNDHTMGKLAVDLPSCLVFWNLLPDLAEECDLLRIKLLSVLTSAGVACAAVDVKLMAVINGLRSLSSKDKEESECAAVSQQNISVREEGAKGRILVVEDDDGDRNGMMAILGSKGYEVQGASRDTEAIECIKARRPDLILMDWKLAKGMDGNSLCSMIKSDISMEDISIIMVTSIGSDYLPVAKELGADDFVSKPVNFDDLFARMKACLLIKGKQRAKDLRQGDRRLAAIMFSDICHFSKIMGRDEKLAVSFTKDHRNMVKGFATPLGGRILKEIGDGLLTEFPSVVNAVKCAISIQKKAQGEMALRIGIHLGDVVASGNDILGDSVNIASRIEPLAEPGGICISQDVLDHVHNKMDINTESMGFRDLKNISRRICIHKVVV